MNVESDVTIDLDAYFTRIGYAGVRRPTMETLRALHLAHATHIPFENLDVLPRTHMALAVDVDGGSWLADVGFGGWGLLQPIPLVADREAPQYSWNFRLHREGELWVLQGLLPGGWQDLYQAAEKPFSDRQNMRI